MPRNGDVGTGPTSGPVALTDVLRVAPLATTGTWLSLAADVLVRRRYGTWSEASFLGVFRCGGLYALFDVVYFHAPTEDAGRRTAPIGLTALSLAATGPDALVGRLYGDAPQA